MIEVLLASIVAVFFLGKSTKDIEEKTQRASKLKTIVLFVLTIAVSVFYYKTYQVASIYNSVLVEGLRESINDSTDQPADTISGVCIMNFFNSGGTYNREVKNIKPSDSDISAGGVSLRISSHFEKGYSLKSKSEFENDLLYKSPFDNLGIVYNIRTVTSNIPSVLPFFYTIHDSFPMKDPKGKYQTDFNFYDLNHNPEIIKFHGYTTNGRGGLEERPVDGQLFSNAYVAEALLRTNKDYYKNPKGVCWFDVSLGSTGTNTIGFFTAADISQYVNHVLIDSKAYVMNLELVYDVPIQINPYDSCMKVGPYGIYVDGKCLKENNGRMSFHVMLPTLANLQLIRSLILTTILTALVSLLFSNLYYLARRKALQFKERHIESVDEKGLKHFMTYLYFIIGLVLVVIIYFTWLVFIDEPLDVPDKWIPYIFVIILVLFALFVYFTYRQFDKIIVRKK